MFHIKGTTIQIEKRLINDRLCVLKVSWKIRIPTIYIFFSSLVGKIVISLKSSLLFNSFYYLFYL